MAESSGSPAGRPAASGDAAGKKRTSRGGHRPRAAPTPAAPKAAQSVEAAAPAPRRRAPTASRPATSNRRSAPSGPGGPYRAPMTTSSPPSAAPAPASRKHERAAVVQTPAARKAEEARKAQRREARERTRAAEAAAARAREAELVRAEKERAGMAAEEARYRGLLSRLLHYTSQRAEAAARVKEVLDVAQRRMAFHGQLRAETIADLRSPASRRALKSDVKKGTALVKRVTALTEDTVPLVLKDVETCNLARYASEIAVSIVGERMKPTDVDSVVPVAVAMHARYADFTPMLMHTLFASMTSAVELCGVGSTPQEAGTAKRSPNPVLIAISNARSRTPLVASEFSTSNDLLSVAASTATAAGDASAAASAAAAAAAAENQKNAAQRVRLLLRLMYELLAARVYEDTAAATGIMLALMGADPNAALSLGPAAGSAASEDVTAGVNPFQRAREAPPAGGKAVPEKLVKKCIRELPLLLSVMKHMPDDFLGIPGRRTRTWLAGEAGDVVHAWVAAHSGVHEDIPITVAIVTPAGVHPWPAPHPIQVAPVASVECAPVAAVLPTSREVPSVVFTPAEQAAILRQADKYYDVLCTGLASEHVYLKRAEKRNDLLLFQKGELPERVVLEFDTLKASFEKLSQSVHSLAELLDRDVPELPDVVPDDPSTSHGGLSFWAGSVGGAPRGPFEDEAARAFYRDIVQLRDTIPAVLLDVDAATLAAAAAPDAAADGAGPTSHRAVASEDKSRIKGTLDSALTQLFGERPKGAPAQTAAAPQRAAAAAPPVPVVAPVAPAPAPLPVPIPVNVSFSSRDAGGADDDDDDFNATRELPDLIAVGDDAIAALPDTLRASIVRFQMLLDRLARCGSRESIDAWTNDFIMEQCCTKANRARLLQYIFKSPPAFTDLYPYHARLVATLDAAHPGFAVVLVRMLAEELKYLFRRTGGGGGGRRGLAGDALLTGSLYERKMKDVKLLCELVKFNVCPASLLFGAMNRCLDDASVESLALLGVILESVGRYLHVTPDTHENMCRILDRIKLMRAAPRISAATADALDAAYFIVIPPARAAKPPKQRPVVHAFIRHLMLNCLTEGSVDDVLRTLRKLPWSDDACVERWVAKTAITASRLDCTRIEHVMSLIAGLRSYHDRIAVRLLDWVCDMIISSLEGSPTACMRSQSGDTPTDAPGVPIARTSTLRMAQRRMGAVRLLGEAYNYKLCDSNLIFRILYSMLNIGHAIPAPQRVAIVEAVNKVINDTGAGRNPLVLPPDDAGVGGWGFHPLVPCTNDGPTDHIRIRMVCTLLDTCGAFFTRGAVAARLDRFLTYFQRYALSKVQVPIDTEFAIADVFQSLRPHAQRFMTFGEAEAAAVQLEREEADAAADIAAAWTRAAAASSAGSVADVTAGMQALGITRGLMDDASMSSSSDDDDDNAEEGDAEDVASEDDEEEGVEGEQQEVDADAAGEEEEEEAAAPVDDAYARHTGEDDEFEREFQSMMSEALEARRQQQSMSRISAEHMSLPSAVMRVASEDEDGEEEVQPQEGVRLTLLKRRGGAAAGRATGAASSTVRVETRTVIVPRGVALAEGALRAAAERRTEAEWLKKRTLQLHEASEAAEYAAHVAHMSGVGSWRRDVAPPDTSSAAALGDDVVGSFASTGDRGRGRGGARGRGRGRGRGAASS